MTIEAIRLTIHGLHHDLLHPTTPEDAANALSTVHSLIHDSDEYSWAASWFIAVSTQALHTLRDANVPRALASGVIFAPYTTNPATGEPLTPVQTAAMQLIVAGANEDYDTLRALLGVYVDADSPLVSSADELLDNLAYLAQAWHGQICGGGHR